MELPSPFICPWTASLQTSFQSASLIDESEPTWVLIGSVEADGFMMSLWWVITNHQLCCWFNFPQWLLFSLRIWLCTEGGERSLIGSQLQCEHCSVILFIYLTILQKHWPHKLYFVILVRSMTHICRSVRGSRRARCKVLFIPSYNGCITVKWFYFLKSVLVLALPHLVNIFTLLVVFYPKYWVDILWKQQQCCCNLDIEVLWCFVNCKILRCMYCVSQYAQKRIYIL